MDTALVDLPCVEIDESQGIAFGHGQTVSCGELPEGPIKVVANGRFAGVGERNDQGLLKAKRALSSQQD
jgi:tRNA pseudouridine55 synthase